MAVSVHWESFFVGVGFWYMAVSSPFLWVLGSGIWLFSVNWESFFVGVGFWYMAVFCKLGVLFCGCWVLVYGCFL